MDMDQVEIDAAYDQAIYAPLADQIRKRYASISEAVRGRLGPRHRVAYGPTEIEKLDIYRTKRPNAPIFVYVHGGAWLAGTAAATAFPAELFVNAGAHYITLDFVQIREAGGDLRVMADQVRRVAMLISSISGASPRGDTSLASHLLRIGRRNSVCPPIS
jgi:arylformamidase